MPGESRSMYKKMWDRMQSELEELKKKDVIETVQYYIDDKKYGKPIEKRYCFALNIDDILKIMCQIETDVRLEKYGKNTTKSQ